MNGVRRTAGTGVASFARKAMSQLPEDKAWLDGCPTRLRAPLLRCARGDAPPNVALMHLFAEAAEPSEIEAALICAQKALHEADDVSPAAVASLRAALALAQSTTRSYEMVRSVLRSVHHEMTAFSGLVSVRKPVLQPVWAPWWLQ